MKIIDLLNKIANGEEVPKKIKYDDKIYYMVGNNDYENYEYEEEPTLMYAISNTHNVNDEVEIIEEDKLKTKITIVDKEGNEKEYLIELGEGLKEGEKIFKADNGKWYIQKLIDEKSEFYKWLDEFKPTIYYSIEEDKKIEKLPMIDGTANILLTTNQTRRKINEIINYINRGEK